MYLLIAFHHEIATIYTATAWTLWANWHHKELLFDGNSVARKGHNLPYICFLQCINTLSPR